MNNPATGFTQKIARTYGSEKAINITGIDKIRLKSDLINESIVKGIRETMLYKFVLDKPPGHKIHNEPRINYFKRMRKTILSHLTFYLEYDDHKIVNFIIL